MDSAALPMAPPRAPTLASLTAWLAALTALLVLAWLAWLAALPAPPPAAAPPEPGRMLRHVAALAAAPRPIATPANAQARQYILGQLRGMGLAPQVHTGTVQKTTIRYWGGTHVTLGVVHNIVVQLAGSAPDRSRRPALLLATHYDTGNATLGAARGGAQVAAMLETARALRTGPAHANDIVLLFADGENVGTLGAKGFAEQHRLAQRIGLVLKFDSTGSAGAPLLYDAAGADGSILRGWAGAAPGTSGSSLLARLYQLLPDTPRIGPLATLDAPALLFVNTEGRFGREGTLDTPARLDPAMLAQLGQTMGRLARHFGDAPLARGAHSAHAWFGLPLIGQVQHPAILSWGLAALAGLLLARGYRTALAQAGDTVAPLLQGVFGMALLLLATRMALWERREQLGELARTADAGPALFFAAVGGCLFIAALYLLRKVAGAAPVFLGAMAWLTVAQVLILLVAPEAAWLLAWPLVASLGAFTLLQPPRGLPFRVAIVVSALGVTLVLFVPILRDAWTALAPAGLYLPAAVIAVMLACFASLLLLLPGARLAGAALGLAVAAGLTWPGLSWPSLSWPGLSRPGLSWPGPASAPAAPELPALAPNRLVYFKDMNSWRAYWLLPPQPLDAWSRQLFPTLARPAIHVDVFGWHSPRQWYAVAPREDRIAYPETFIIRNPAPGKSGVRRVEFTLRSKNRAPQVELWAAGTKLWRSTVNGRVLTARESAWSMSLYGMQDQLLRFTIDASATELLAVVVEERMPGLPGHLLPPGAPRRMTGTGMTISSDVLRF